MLTSAVLSSPLAHTDFNSNYTASCETCDFITTQVVNLSNTINYPPVHSDKIMGAIINHHFIYIYCIALWAMHSEINVTFPCFMEHTMVVRGALLPNTIWCIVMPLVHHDDVIKWKHFPRYWPYVRGIHQSPVNSPHKGRWHRALMFSLICVWIYSWVNNREAGDLRRYRAHYDAIVMISWSCPLWCHCNDINYHLLLCHQSFKVLQSSMQYLSYQCIHFIHLVVGAWLCAFSLLAHSNFTRHITITHFSLFLT